jgi:hypothetical protein
VILETEPGRCQPVIAGQPWSTGLPQWRIPICGEYPRAAQVFVAGTVGGVTGGVANTVGGLTGGLTGAVSGALGGS